MRAGHRWDRENARAWPRRGCPTDRARRRSATHPMQLPDRRCCSIRPIRLPTFADGPLRSRRSSPGRSIRSGIGNDRRRRRARCGSRGRPEGHLVRRPGPLVNRTSARRRARSCALTLIEDLDFEIAGRGQAAEEAVAVRRWGTRSASAATPSAVVRVFDQDGGTASAAPGRPALSDLVDGLVHFGRSRRR